jgi:sigma-B regulation protein RsbU (phosphoserine phosphatase)
MFLDGGDRLEPAYALGGSPSADGVASINETMRVRREPIRLQGGERLALPLATKDKLIGVMLLGPKKSEEPYSFSDIRLLQNVAGQTGLAIENSQLTEAVAHEVAARERLNRELEIAREVQQKLFPQQLPVVPGIHYAGKCRPAQSVGGDYFDFLELPNGGLGVAVGDVSGKGIPAALLMASLQACLRGQIMDGATDLSKLMRNINRLIYDASPVNRYATFFYGQYCQSSGNFTYVNAGHNPPFLLRNDEAIPLGDGGPVIGLFQNAQYKQGEIAIQPGDIFLGYTDGVSEAMNAADEEWGEPNMIDETRGCRGLEPSAMIDCLIAGADRFANGAPQHDDMTLIVAKFG